MTARDPFPGIETLSARVIRPLWALLAWVYLYLLLLLTAWVAISALATGWQPAVVTSGSMQPNLRPGDVLLLDDPTAELIGQRSVISFQPLDDPETIITHRVFAVEAAGYVTKGDANAVPDTALVTPEQVVGVGRLVIPLVGLPSLWWANGNTVGLVAWLVATAGAFATAVLSLRRRDDRTRPSATAHSPTAATAIRRVRALVGVMILSQYIIEPHRFEIPGLGVAPWQTLIGSLILLAVINGVSLSAARSGRPTLMARVSVFELVGDTAMVILLTTATGTAGIGWVLFALPIIEAASRFRLAGALLHWMLLTGVALASRIWMIEHVETPGTVLIHELERTLDQLSVLLLVIIPGAYLVEHLTGDVAAQRHATQAATERGQLLQHVAETSREVNRLGAEVLDTILAAVDALGFDRSDVIARLGPGEPWTVLASTGTDQRALPAPGSAGSGVLAADLVHPHVVVTDQDPDPADRAGLIDAGAELLVRMTVTERDGSHVALRAAATSRQTLRAGAIEALGLLSGQAAVALQNEQLVAELRTIHDEMAHHASHDSLTGLVNRAGFMARLSEAIGAWDDPASRHSVLFLDLNGFKSINDRLGHEAGDHLLIQVARRLEAAVGDRGYLARLGGDEFTILVNPVTDPRHAEELAVEIRRVLVEPFMIGAEAVRVGTSVGIAFVEPGVGDSELLRRADTAMYANKSGYADTTGHGRAPFTRYHPSLDAADRQRARMVDELGKAIESDRLALHYQPLIRVETGTMAGVEALLRWEHPEYGRVEPTLVLSLAESADLMAELNGWIMRRAAADIVSWRLAPGTDFFVTINASPSELASHYFVPNVVEALMHFQLPPSNMIIELSERIAGEDQAYRAVIDGLAELGVGLALDDFGEGKTSLAHLRGLPIAMLKLDRRLVHQAALSRPDRIILESVVSLAHELEFTVVAEGVESAVQRDVCIEAGADLLQGYLLHRPSPPQVIAALLRQADHVVPVATS